LLTYTVGVVAEIDELSMNLVALLKDCIGPIAAVVAVTDVLNLSGSQPSIESFALFVAIVIFGAFVIDVVRDGLIETIESDSVRAL
jgi:hypothetical protein